MDAIFADGCDVRIAGMHWQDRKKIARSASLQRGREPKSRMRESRTSRSVEAGARTPRLVRLDSEPSATRKWPLIGSGWTRVWLLCSISS